MKYFKSRWPNVNYQELVKHYGAKPILQNEIYKWLGEQEMRGTFVGTVPGSQCWHVEGDSHRLMFQLRWS